MPCPPFPGDPSDPQTRIPPKSRRARRPQSPSTIFSRKKGVKNHTLLQEPRHSSDGSGSSRIPLNPNTSQGLACLDIGNIPVLEKPRSHKTLRSSSLFFSFSLEKRFPGRVHVPSPARGCRLGKGGWPSFRVVGKREGGGGGGGAA